MTTIDEKRVYADRSGRREAYLASALGLVVVAVSGDQVGEFRVVRRGTARAVATGGGRVAAAVDGDVVVSVADADGGDAGDGTGEDARTADDALVSLGFGPATAVGVGGDGGTVLAVAPDGEVCRVAVDAIPTAGSGPDRDAWTALGTVGDVRAVDGRLLATADGVVRAGDDGLSRVGLDAVRDVAGVGRGAPLAATADGLYALGNGWLRAREGPHARVAADPTGEGAPLAVPGDASAETSGRADASDDAAGTAADRADRADRAVLVRDDGEWVDAGLGGGPVADVAVADGVRYAVTASGTLRVDAGDGVRSQALGLATTALAVR